MTRKHDHLGSARITLDNAARVIESQSYTAYGDHRTHDGEAARTSYIGRETDKESDLGFGACPEALRGSVRLYDPTYGRFLSVDPLWGKYLPLQSYQYAGNNPVMFLDDNGKHIVGNRNVDREYLKSTMLDQFGVEIGFNEDNAMTLSQQQLTSASERLGIESFGQLLQIEELILSKKTVNVVALGGTEDLATGLTLTGPNAAGIMGGGTYGVAQTGVKQSEVFVSDPDRPSNSFIVIRPEIAKIETFSAQGGGRTSPCGPCVLLHALVDHALPWKRLGVDATRKESVEGHNKALIQSGSEKIRDGLDHRDEGQTR